MRVGGRPGANSVSTWTCLVASSSVISRQTPAITSVISAGDLVVPNWLKSARIRLTTSDAELASRIMRSKVTLARSRLGGLADNHRLHACDVATIAAKG